jgi:hypothetical protein
VTILFLTAGAIMAERACDGPPDSAETPNPCPRSQARLVALAATPDQPCHLPPSYEFRPNVEDHASPGSERAWPYVNMT